MSVSPTATATTAARSPLGSPPSPPSTVLALSYLRGSGPTQVTAQRPPLPCHRVRVLSTSLSLCHPCAPSAAAAAAPPVIRPPDAFRVVPACEDETTRCPHHIHHYHSPQHTDQVAAVCAGTKEMTQPCLIHRHAISLAP